ncbi:hypothetical protein [Mycolicibacterium llatzerense]|uniref:hypothetical protein n=1 Tax=Mycolicibacterium llatzerense TaxID=280871 RepID=UPI0021B67DCF|nr:hypothetical protein [Mycolicibacterium llatzerense]MCT7372647.1 hypothetical protein [Mycolicibacterium llatzerense]
MTTDITPKKRLPRWKKVLIGIGVFFVAWIILGVIIGPDKGKKSETAAPAATTTTASTTSPAAQETTASATSTPAAASAAPQPAPAPAAEIAPLPPAVSSDQQIATAAEKYIKENWSMAPDASWQAFECTAGMTCWQPYVVHFEFASGVLRPTLQIDRTSQKALGTKAAQNMASFIGFSKEPWAQQIDWVEVTDGAGVHVAQESVSHH